MVAAYLQHDNCIIKQENGLSLIIKGWEEKNDRSLRIG